MQRIHSLLVRLKHDQRGLTTVEYAIILCVIVAVTVGLWDDFGSAIKTRLEADTNAITADLNDE